MKLSLVGMPGGGKSTVGRLLARQLDAPFIDSDAEIEKTLGGETIKDYKITRCLGRGGLTPETQRPPRGRATREPIAAWEPMWTASSQSATHRWCSAR